MRIAGSVALVIGANRGLGRALAQALLQRDVAKLDVTARGGPGQPPPRTVRSWV